MSLGLAGYRPWTGELGGSWRTPWPVARIALRMIVRRRLFWFLYGLALFNFLFFFFGMYLLSQLKGMVPDAPGTGIMVLFGDMRRLAVVLERTLHLDGSGETYRRFFFMQGYIVMGVLAMAGSVLVGNDYQYGSMPYYLSKPLTRWHYLAGKLLAVILFLNLTTTLPAIVLYVQYAMLEDWDLLVERTALLWGILAYGGLLSVVLPTLVVALASWLRKAVPLVLVWTGLLIFCRIFSRVLVNGLGLDESWRLIDIWNNLYILGSHALGVAIIERQRDRIIPHPEAWEAGLVLAAVTLAAMLYLARRVRAVEVVQ